MSGNGNGNGRRYPLAPVPKRRGRGRPKGVKNSHPKQRYPGCTTKESRFVAEYLKDPTNAAAAARRAGYTDNSAKMAWQILRRPKIRAVIAEQRLDIAETTHIDVAALMEQEGAMATSDIRDYPPFKNLGIPDRLAPAISSIRLVRTVRSFQDGSIEEREEHNVQLWPKPGALERLERMHGLFEKDNRQRPALFSQTNIFQQNNNEVSLDFGDLPEEAFDAIEAAYKEKRDLMVIDVEGAEEG